MTEDGEIDKEEKDVQEEENKDILNVEKDEKKEIEQKETIKGNFEENIEPEKKTDEGKETEKEEEQKKSENRILKGFFIAIICFAVVFVLSTFIINSSNDFNYRGIDFSIYKTGELTFYKAIFPVYSEITGKVALNYNLYLRNDPRRLEKEIPLNGSLVFLENMVLNMTEDFNCKGEGIIAIANFLKLETFGTKIIKDQNATCDEQGRYNYINIFPGDSSRIEQTGKACYNLYVNNCEILKVTERFMIENLVKIEELIE